MTIALEYDEQLARVRITVEPGLLKRYTFAADTESWVANGGGSVARVATPSDDGDGSLQYTPPGAVATVGAILGGVFLPMINPAANHVISLRVRSSAGHADVVAAVDWYDAGGVNLSTGGLGAPVNCPAGVWTTVTSAPLTPPGTATQMRPRMRLGSTPAVSNIFNLDSAAISYAFAAAVTSVKIERTISGRPFATVRGGGALPATGGAVLLDDYEFVPGVVNTYRAVYYSAVGAVLGFESVTITPVIDAVWLKSVARPYLNRRVTVQDYTAPQRKSRAGVFDIAGRTMPIVVSDIATSRRWSTTVMTRTLDDAHALDLLLASGDIVHVQVPAGFDIPAGYVSIGDTSLGRLSRPLSDDRRLTEIPMTECAPPGPDVVGSTSTWAGLLAAYGSWTAVLAAFPTWQDVLDYVAAADTVIVP